MVGRLVLVRSTLFGDIPQGRRRPAATAAHQAIQCSHSGASYAVQGLESVCNCSILETKT